MSHGDACYLGMLILGMLILGMVSTATAQFPRACMQNITDQTGVCCPGYRPWDPPCGGESRGVCLQLVDAHETFFPAKPDHMHDDRLNWPKAFFTKVCHCFGNRAGYACHECKFGYHGPECTQRRIQKRRNIMSLSKEEQQRFMDLIQTAKVANSDYVALRADQHDPPQGNVQFVNLTVYDYFIYIHFYSARHTNVRNATVPCDTSRTHFDFSHEGSGFPTFHRLLILLWEREFQKLARDDKFMFPYWDWVGNEHHCEVCTNELFGAINYTDPDGLIDTRSPFSKWYTMCQTRQINGSGCRYCDPGARFPGIVRRPVKEYRFPTIKEVDSILSMQNYDRPPYDELAGRDIFRNCFEGNCPMPGQSYSIHNLVHAWFNGTLSGVTTSTNDPLFLVHHTMIDKLFERWLRMHKQHVTQMPEFGGPVGHHRDAVMVPMFPRHFHRWYFTDSRSLGYDYDNFDYGKRHRRLPDSYLEALEAEEEENFNLVAMAITLPVILSLLFVVMMYRDRLRHAGAATYRLLHEVPSNGHIENRNGNFVRTLNKEFSSDPKANLASKGSFKGYLQSLATDSELDLTDEEQKPLVVEEITKSKNGVTIH